MIRNKSEGCRCQHYHKLIRDYHVFQVCQTDNQQCPACEKSCRRQLHVNKKQPYHEACETGRVYPSSGEAFNPPDIWICQLLRRRLPVIAEPSGRHFIKYIYCTAACRKSDHQRSCSLDYHHCHFRFPPVFPLFYQFLFFITTSFCSFCRFMTDAVAHFMWKYLMTEVTIYYTKRGGTLPIFTIKGGD